MILKNVFKTYFDRYDTQGVFHNGFIQSIDLSSYVDFTFLNDLSTAIVDSYLFNEFSNRIVLDRWKKFMKWDTENKRFIIDPTFYTNAVNALFVYLAKSEKFYGILNTNFSTLSATEMETINHGARSGSKSYGAQTIGRDYDKVVVELMRGTETENHATHTDTQTKGQYTDVETNATYTDTENVGAHTETLDKDSFTDTENVGQRIDSETIGSQTNSGTKTEQIHPFDANDFVDDTHTIENTTNGAQTNGTTQGAQTNSNVHGEQSETTSFSAQTNSNVYGAREKTNDFGEQETVTEYGAIENTKSFGKTSNETKARSDAETKGAHTDNESISAYIDTKTRTKVLILSPEKYYMILQELADKNIYTLFADAVNSCFLSDVYEFQALENGGIII